MPGAFGAADVAELERAIQLAIAPAFLLTGIFSLLNVLAGRLARLQRIAFKIERQSAVGSCLQSRFTLSGVHARPRSALVDRERAIRENRSPALPGEQARLAQRARCAHGAILGCVLAAILLCSLIFISFMGIFLGLRVAWVLGVLLIAAMLALVGALGLFLREVHLASRHLPLDLDD